MFRILILAWIKDITSDSEIAFSLDFIDIGNQKDIISPKCNVRLCSFKNALKRN